MGTAAARAFLSLKPIPVPEPWAALLLPVPSFPVPPPDRVPVAAVTERISARLKARFQIGSEVFIQVQQTDHDETRALYSKHAPEWIPEIGLGIWPDREPPHVWTKEEFMAMVPGEKRTKPMFQVFRVTSSERGKESARRLMSGFGPFLEVLTPLNGDQFLEKCTSLFLPSIQDPACSCFPFYVPLLEGKTLAAATAEKLGVWLCGATAYIRESIEDGGTLVVSREPLEPVLEELGGRFEKQPEPVWRIPC